jgi:hypothetical protein
MAHPDLALPPVTPEAKEYLVGSPRAHWQEFPYGERQYEDYQRLYNELFPGKPDVHEHGGHLALRADRRCRHEFWPDGTGRTCVPRRRLGARLAARAAREAEVGY